MQTKERTASVVQQFTDIEPTEFRQKADNLWRAAERLKDTVAEQVESELITPVQGCAVISCVTGQLFGYGEFHGLVQPGQLALQQNGQRHN